MTAEELERELLRDLSILGAWLADEKFATELYRALAGNAWRKAAFEGHVSLSWGRAEALVNELRERQGEEPLALAQTGREAEVSDDVLAALGGAGWSATALDTTEHDAAHLARPESPPPKGHGERMAPVGDSHEWEREANEEADEEIRRRLGGG